MHAEDQEREIGKVADQMDRDGDRMEERLEQVGEHIDDAKAAADQRPEAGSDIVGDVAGDWEDEAQGADHGEDAVDAAEPNEDKREIDS